MSWAGVLRGFMRHGNERAVPAAAAAIAAAVAVASSTWGLTSNAEGHTGTTTTTTTARSVIAAGAGVTTAHGRDANDVPLPVHKLACRAGVPPPRQPVVLLCCGSFNPPTVMHLRCVELAAEELRRRGHDVWGAYLSPVADAYSKPELAPAADRIAMCRLAAGEAIEPPGEPSQLQAQPRAAGSAGSGAAAPGSRWGQAGSADQKPDPESDFVMVYDWEARRPGYTRTLAVLRRVQSELRDWLGTAAEAAEAPPQRPPPSAAPPAAAPAATREGPASTRLASGAERGTGAPAAAAAAAGAPDSGVASPRVMLLCGADVLASMAVPGVWRDPDVILAEHGVVCVARYGTDLERLLATPGTVLYDHRDRVVLVYDRVGNSISSSAVRAELAAGRPVRHLVPPGVLSYIYEKGLYGARVRHVGGESGTGSGS